MWSCSVNPVETSLQLSCLTCIWVWHWVTYIVGIDCEKMKCSWRLTPLNRIFLQKMLVTQLVNIFSVFYVTRRFINMFIRSTTGPYPETVQKSSTSCPNYLWASVILFSLYALVSQIVLLASRYQNWYNYVKGLHPCCDRYNDWFVHRMLPKQQKDMNCHFQCVNYDFMQVSH
jgi:hypothetical protein